MAAVLVVAGLALAALPMLGRPIGRRIRPAEWAELCLIGLVGGVVLVEAGAVLLAAPTVLRAAGVHAVARACERLLGPLVPLGPVAGWVAAGVALVVPVAAAGGWRRDRRRLAGLAVERCLGEHRLGDGYELVVLPTDEPLAYSVTGPAQIVVSRGLIGALPPAQLDAVIAHERAHLSARHSRLLLIAAAARQALWFWPPATRSQAAFRSAIERWADDDATAGDAARRRELRDALVSMATVPIAAPVAGFSLAEAVNERVEAMERPYEATFALRALVYVPGTLAMATVFVALSAWMSQARLVVAMAGGCAV